MKVKVEYDPTHAVKYINDILSKDCAVLGVEGEAMLVLAYNKGYNDCIEQMQGLERDMIYYH